MYIYDQIDQRIVDERVAQFRDQTRRFLAGSCPRTISGRCGCKMASTFSAMRRCCASRSPTACSLRASCASSRTSRARTTAATATSARARTSSSTGRSSRTCRRSSPSSRPCRCTRSRRAATASATSPPITSPASRRTRSSIRSCGANSCASGRRFNPEFAYLPRKFKIAITGARGRSRGRPGARRRPAGGAQRRRARSASACSSAAAWAARPILGAVIREFLPWQHLLTYLEAILRVYNRYGRRDNKYKARIKILVKDLHAGRFPRGGRSRMGST